MRALGVLACARKGRLLFSRSLIVFFVKRKNPRRKEKGGYGRGTVGFSSPCSRSRPTLDLRHGVLTPFSYYNCGYNYYYPLHDAQKAKRRRGRLQVERARCGQDALLDQWPRCDWAMPGFSFAHHTRAFALIENGASRKGMWKKNEAFTGQEKGSRGAPGPPAFRFFFHCRHTASRHTGKSTRRGTATEGKKKAKKRRDRRRSAPTAVNQKTQRQTASREKKGRKEWGEGRVRVGCKKKTGEPRARADSKTGEKKPPLFFFDSPGRWARG